MLAELTYRCPLACPYCSNPLNMTGPESEMSTDEWRDILARPPRLACCTCIFLAASRPHAATSASLSPIAPRPDFTPIDHFRRRPDQNRASPISSRPVSTMCSCRFRIPKRPAPTGLAATRAAMRKSMKSPPGWSEEGPAADRQCGDSSRQYRAGRRDGRSRGKNSAQGESKSPIHNITAGRLHNRAHLMPTASRARSLSAEVEERRLRYKGVNRHRPCRARLSTPIIQALQNGWRPHDPECFCTGKVLPCQCGGNDFPASKFWNALKSRSPRSGANSPAFNAFRRDEWMQTLPLLRAQEHDFGGCRCRRWLCSATPKPAIRSAKIAASCSDLREIAATRFPLNMSPRFSPRRIPKSKAKAAVKEQA